MTHGSAEILRMLNHGFGALASGACDLWPDDLREASDPLDARVCPALNNGVDRADFATTRAASADAFADVLAMLDRLETRLAASGPSSSEIACRKPTPASLPPLRLDAACHGLLKCNLRRLITPPALPAHAGRMLALPGMRATVYPDPLERGRHAFRSPPYGVAPRGPDRPWDP